MWDIKSFSTVPRCSRAKTAIARKVGKKETKQKRHNKETEWVNPVREERRRSYTEQMRYFSQGEEMKVIDCYLNIDPPQVCKHMHTYECKHTSVHVHARTKTYALHVNVTGPVS